MNKDTKPIYVIDEYELSNEESDKNRKIVGLYLPETDEGKLFDDAELGQIAWMTEEASRRSK
jgi:hypothetical protein